MANETSSARALPTSIDLPLTNWASRFMAGEHNCLLNRVAPRAVVSLRYGKYVKYGLEEWMPQNANWAQGSDGNMANASGKQQIAYDTARKALVGSFHDIEGEEDAKYGINTDQDRLREAIVGMNKWLDYEFYTNITSVASSFGTVSPASTPWSAPDFDIIAAVNGIKATMQPYIPTHIILPYDAQLKIASSNTQVKEIIKVATATQGIMASQLTTANFPSVLCGLQVITSLSFYVSSGIGATPTTWAQQFPNDAIIFVKYQPGEGTPASDYDPKLKEIMAEAQGTVATDWIVIPKDSYSWIKMFCYQNIAGGFKVMRKYDDWKQTTLIRPQIEGLGVQVTGAEGAYKVTGVTSAYGAA